MKNASQVRDLDVLYTMAREAYREADYYLAAERLIVLARRGDARGQYALGYLYYQGQGVLGDRARAMELFRQAAAQGDSKARTALMLLEGRGTTAPTSLAPAVSVPVGGRESAGAANEPVRPPAEVQVPAGPGPAAREPPVEREPVAAAEAPVPPPTAIAELPPSEPSTPSETPVAAEVPVPAGSPPPAGEQIVEDAEIPFSAAWLRRQTGAQFTIQLAGGSSEQRLEAFARRRQLAEPAAVVETRLDGQPWFIVLYGVYSDLNQAREALRALPEELRRDRPWIRPLGDVLASLPAS